LNLRAALLTHIGLHRSRNEDRAWADVPQGLFGVADGVGGVPGGAEAAEAARVAIQDGFARALRDGACPPLEPLVQQANRAVRRLGEQLFPATGIATTLTLGVFQENELRLAHVGDSRCYGWNRAGFARLTTDHSDGRVLSRCLGLDEPVSVDLIHRPLEQGDRYLFCTDGLTNFSREAHIAASLLDGDDPAAIAGSLVRAALAGGGGDNVTVVVVLVG